jgi:hypothetical protein
VVGLLGRATAVLPEAAMADVADDLVGVAFDMSNNVRPNANYPLLLFH